MASIKLKHTSGNGTILHSPAANPTNDVTLKLPSTSGTAGQVLKVASANHSSTNAELEFAGGGKILQVVSTTKTDTFTTNSTSLVDITGLSLAITPSSSSNKILVHLELEYGGSNIYFFGRVLRDSTAIGLGDANSNHTRCSFMIMTQGLASGANTEYKGKHTSYQILDTPSYSVGDTLTYKIQAQSYSGDNRTLTINRSGQDGDSSGNSVNWQGRSSSTLTLMEVAA